MTSKKPRADWDAVERAYRANLISIRAIAAEHRVSDTAIRKKAKELGWVQDLGARVQQEIRNKLIQDEVRETVRKDPLLQTEIVAEAANTGVRIVRTHRTDIRRAAETAGLLLEQLVQVAAGRQEIEQIIEDETRDDSSTQRRNQMLRAVSLPQHASTMLNLSAAIKNLVALERQAYNLDDAPPSEETYEQRLQRLIQGSQPQ
ncbi:hypothetical protein [uncultured Pseudomonas sp.]|uniref:hypothetical protein n=1 Tax=uncultured Pseudomonas sp. TaxID=114707 RepID=UPI0025F35280|nr:hypothetical protein [uncultured Pseudomonas sp.]